MPEPCKHPNPQLLDHGNVFCPECQQYGGVGDYERGRADVLSRLQSASAYLDKRVQDNLDLPMADLEYVLDLIYERGSEDEI